MHDLFFVLVGIETCYYLHLLLKKLTQIQYMILVEVIIIKKIKKTRTKRDFDAISIYIDVQIKK